jgi:hypothetical protein
MPANSSTLSDTRVICRADNFKQLYKLPDASVDLIYTGSRLARLI